MSKRVWAFYSETIEGADAPAASFEDIGKSRLMRLSFVKRIRRNFLVSKKYIKDTYDYFKIIHDDSNYMKIRQKTWLNMNSDQKKAQIQKLWGQVRQSVRGSMFLQRAHGKTDDLVFLSNQRRLALEEEMEAK